MSDTLNQFPEQLFFCAVELSAAIRQKDQMLKVFCSRFNIAGDLLKSLILKWQKNGKKRPVPQKVSFSQTVLLVKIAAQFSISFPALRTAVTCRLQPAGRNWGQLENPADKKTVALSDIWQQFQSTATKPVSSPGNRNTADLGYIATQLSPEGFDEIQLLWLCMQHGINAALSGAPGSGKTAAVSAISRVTGKPLYTVNCSERSSDTQIIASPGLFEENGATITRYTDGPLCRAMREGGIFYGDEFNQLPPDMQKRINSALDDRRSIDRNDGERVTAVPGFCGIISYNPRENFYGSELEPSSADRFLHYRFKDWSPRMSAFIANYKFCLQKKRPLPHWSDFKLALQWRGITADGKFVYAQQATGATPDGWIDQASGEFTAPPVIRYLSADKPIRAFRVKMNDLKRYLTRLSYFLHTINQFINKSGEESDSLNVSSFQNKVASLRSDDEDPAVTISEKLHCTSTRIQQIAATIFDSLTEKGFNPNIAANYSTGLVIEQICFNVKQPRIHRLLIDYAADCGIMTPLSPVRSLEN